jgi:hypothetical protein
MERMEMLAVWRMASLVVGALLLIAVCCGAIARENENWRK